MAATAKKNNSFAIWVSVAVVAVLVLVGALVVWMNNAAKDPGELPTASGIDTTTGAIVVGDGPDTVSTFVDFMCPYCNAFEQTYGDTIQGLIEDGSITLELHPVTILDRLSLGTEFSTRAASAMYCVAEYSPDAVLPFLQTMYENQPSENTEGLTDEQIAEIASAVGADAAVDCIMAGTYMDFATAMTDNMPANPETGSVGTPTMLINGEYITLTGDVDADIIAYLS
ncbi:hypothetical protein GCM10009808_26470 [Microbacterium sediminicola]|uniref:Thioredoxin-like fold domain-containing protein n=1 Tax=Microbacterium sediminicola TaxID=415210 RepID=A0ABN2IL18_9MICO